MIFNNHRNPRPKVRRMARLGIPPDKGWMMSDCYCDYERPEFYCERQISRSKKHHVCCECNRKIAPGEGYHLSAGKWDGDFSSFKTCSNCTELRKYVQSHVPCFCWSFGSAIEDAIETASQWNREAPGLLFGAYRRKIEIKRAKRRAEP